MSFCHDVLHDKSRNIFDFWTIQEQSELTMGTPISLGMNFYRKQFKNYKNINFTIIMSKDFLTQSLTFFLIIRKIDKNTQLPKYSRWTNVK